ncbi:Dyp-type peroxidase [Neisseria wadsworthii]|uniref:Dyp-type peroxidase n=1 Tax=Neisseria wadsworthii 9715 TaxID=1030841 RepID=G4CR66_9NEIS|nr:Dyp-type peroxidase [Neisseria wadsworthii]EGZ45479.1 dyp-type peroxidase [Neisseria wadsworthii 9715]QMT35280.1 Dyp-type peroxidase [Neisseria wadsworthii]
MTTPQTAIIPDHCKAGVFIQADVIPGQTGAVKQACKAALETVKLLQSQYPDANLGLTIAFGADFWKSLEHQQEGQEIKPFRALGNGLAPVTQHDVLFHIQSMRQDINFLLMQKIVALFNKMIDIKDETHGFRLIEERGVDGFVDGTENPQGDEEVAEVAIIGKDRPDAGGSYVMYQKYRHDLNKWDKFSIAEQEETIGRSKEDNEEFEGERLHPRAHIARTNLKENGVGLKIVRRSLPYGTVTGEHGLAFICYCNRLHNIEVQLLSMFGEAADGQTDLMLDRLTQAISGGYYFAPSAERLANL